jgi:hypothetical protein
MGVAGRRCIYVKSVRALSWSTSYLLDLYRLISIIVLYRSLLLTRLEISCIGDIEVGAYACIPTNGPRQLPGNPHLHEIRYDQQTETHLILLRTSDSGKLASSSHSFIIESIGVIPAGIPPATD